jgi:hypothetical protein
MKGKNMSRSTKGPNPVDNSTVLEMRALAAKFQAIGIPTYGIVAIITGSNPIIDEADFEANDIDPNAPQNLSLRLKKGSDADEDNAVGKFGNYANGGKIKHVIAQAATVTDAIKQLLAEFDKNADAEARIMSMPGVAAAREKALRNAWAQA